MKYRRKPVVIEAIQWTGENLIEIEQFMNATPVLKIHHMFFTGYILIRTLEGEITASPGDYIIKGVNGEFYPCKPDIFHETYERVEE